MHKFITLLGAVLVTSLTLVHADDHEKVSFSGYLDSDVWTDFSGNFFSNDELDLSMAIRFSDKVSASVCATVASGTIPAGMGLPGGEDVSVYELANDTFEITEDYSRWVAITFDGVSISYESPIGTFTVGDLVYQFGGFNYYFYKRLSMITEESFTRGVGYSFGNEALTQSILAGSADINQVGDLVGITSLAFGEENSLSLYYGVRGSIYEQFKTGSMLFAGLEYLGSIGEMISLKFDLGLQNLPGEERSTAYTLLFEPVFTAGDFSTAMSVYTFIDPDSTGANFVEDEFYAYIEPGHAFTDVLAAGLPLEIHTTDLDEFSDAGSFWVVPTLYVYPADGVEWWIWGQVVAPLGDGDGDGETDDLSYGLGSEIIVTF
ncbi:MAG: hypothetical protein GF401_19315 [Chitinivibrionales bacterium]|nr:hypothetical protein [Chitinivibrionales bacterium]